MPRFLAALLVNLWATAAAAPLTVFSAPREGRFASFFAPSNVPEKSLRRYMRRSSRRHFMALATDSTAAPAATSTEPTLAVDVAYCVVGQERGFTAPLVYESLSRNVIHALNASIAAFLRASVAASAGDAERVHVTGDVFVFAKVDTGEVRNRSSGASANVSFSSSTSGGDAPASRGDIMAVRAAGVRRAAYLLGAARGRGGVAVVRRAGERDSFLLRRRSNPACPLALDPAADPEGARRAIARSRAATGDGDGDRAWARYTREELRLADSMRRRFAVVSLDQASCLDLVRGAEAARGGLRYTHVMKLRADQQVCAPLEAASLLAPALAPALAARGPESGGGGGGGGEGGGSGYGGGGASAVVKQRDHWAFMSRAHADIYFNASHEVLTRCVRRRAYDSFSLAPGSVSEPRLPQALSLTAQAQASPGSGGGGGIGGNHAAAAAVERRCHWQARAHPLDVPNECLLDHWLAANEVPFAEALVPTCIRKSVAVSQPGAPCPEVSFNQRLDTSLC